MGLVTAASVSQTTTDAANTMAPALNEPINQSEKLSGTTAVIAHNISSLETESTSSNIEEDIAIEQPSLSDGGIDDTSINFNNNLITNNNNNNSKNQQIIIYPSISDSITKSESNHSINSDNLIGSTNDNLLMDQPDLQQEQQESNEELQNEGAAAPNGSNMGLQKDYFKDSPEMDQIIGDLATTDLDLLQVIKSFTTAPADGLCELAGGLSLFNDVDVMNMSSDEVQSTPPNRDTKLKDQQEEIARKQVQLQRKHDFLLRRLGKLQARYMGQHISEEVAGLFEHTQRFCKKREREHTQQTKYAMAAAASANHYNDGMNSPSHIPDIIPYMPPPTNQYNNQQMKACSNNAMKTFLKRIENSATAQNCQHSKRTFSMKYFATSGGTNINDSMNSSLASPGGSADNTLQSMTSYTTPIKVFPNPNCVVQRLEDNSVDQLEMVSGMLDCELQTIHTAIDSDATASSSGGESADESVSYNTSSKHSTSM